MPIEPNDECIWISNVFAPGEIAKVRQASDDARKWATEKAIDLDTIYPELTVMEGQCTYRLYRKNK